MSPVTLRLETASTSVLFLCLVVAVGFICNCCDGASFSVSPSCNMDIPSRTALAAVVIEGRTRRVEAVPSRLTRTSASGHGVPFDKNDYFNVTVKPRTVFKGDLPKDPRDGYLPITIGEFAPDEDRQNCVPSFRLGSRYLFFLNGSGTSGSSNRQTPFYRLAGFPAPVSNETVHLVKEYSCNTCSKYR
jgi:hypothetical protein